MEVRRANTGHHGVKYPPSGTSLALLTVPYIFTQDEVLTTGDFLKRARDRGQSLTLETLQKLHEHQLVVPLYRVDDTPIDGQRIDVRPDGGMNARGWTLEAAVQGRLRDPAEEGYSDAWPYAIPPGKRSDRWWNGFVYSSWQLLDLADAMNALNGIERHGERHAAVERYRQLRGLTLALAALSPRYLPGVLGQMSFPDGMDAAGLWRFRAEADTKELLRLAGFDPAQLQKESDNLLLAARYADPMARWMKLLRYASYAGWSRLRDEPLNAMWRRVAAELLLRAHEELAASGDVEPLPDLTGSKWHAPQHDRFTPRYAEAETLERALADLGLSPHPTVILLLEGDTELLHGRRLLGEFGLKQPQQVRAERIMGSKVNPILIARYGITPRIGRRIGDSWLLDATPTALLIAMDPEGHWKTPEQRAARREKLQKAVREEVRAQGADISQEDLDLLIRVDVWGDDTYELANFTDDELVAGIRQLANDDDPEEPNWEVNLRTHLQEARTLHKDIKEPLIKMRIKEDKIRLAEILWPVLLAKCRREWAEETVATPVLRVIAEVRELVAKMSGARALRVPEGFDE